MSLKEFCEKKIYYFIMIVALTIYVCLTLSNPFIRNFNHDEIHAWNIASSFGFIDIVRLMRSEGHTFIWFMLIKPFTSFSIYSIKVLNWMFTFLAVILLWIFAPFKPVEKFLITFSCPFLLIYPVIARCYGIGILLLFLVVILYKRRFDKPILFSILIFLAANTSLMAAIPASILGFIYSIEILKQKQKQKILPLLILILVPISLYIQWHNPIIPFYSENYVFSDRVKSFFLEGYLFDWCSKLAYIIYPGIFLSSILYFSKNKRILLFLLSSWLVLIGIFFTVYCGFDYHFYFLYIYLILAYWVGYENNNSYKKIFITFFILLSSLFCFKKVSNVWLFNTYYRDTAACILSNVSPNSYIYANLFEVNILLPYLYNLNLKDFEDNSLVSFDNYRNIYSKRILPDYDKIFKSAPYNSYLLIKPAQAAGLDFKDKNRFCECNDFILYKIK